jgi:hypothetical protein
MRVALKAALTLGLAVGLMTAAYAQGQGRGGSGPGGLLTNPGVKKELKLTDDQVKKVEDALAKVQDKHKDDFARFREMSREERQKTMRAFAEDYNKAVAGVLDANQMKRFKQIQWQLAGFGALEDPEVQKTLKLSDDQQKKLTVIFEESGKKMQELFRGGNVEGGREKFDKIRKETEEKANGVLTDEQKKQWKEMQGEPFKLEATPPRR